MRLLVLAVVISGCSSANAPVYGLDTQTSQTILYTVSAPYHLTGVSPVGQQGQLFTSVPQVGEDPYKMIFDYAGTEIMVSQPLDWLAINEDLPIQNEVTYSDANVVCTSWKGTLTVTAGAPHWHFAINASCNTVGGLSIHGDWSEYH